MLTIVLTELQFESISLEFVISTLLKYANGIYCRAFDP